MSFVCLIELRDDLGCGDGRSRDWWKGRYFLDAQLMATQLINKNTFGLKRNDVLAFGLWECWLNMIFYVHWLASHFEINRSVRMELIQPALLSVDSWSDNLIESRMEHKICKQLPTVSQIGTPVRFRFTLNVLVAAHFLGKNHVTNWLSPRSCMMSPPNRWFIRNEI